MTTIIENVEDGQWDEDRELLERNLFEAAAALLTHTGVDTIEMIGDDFTITVKLKTEMNDEPSEKRTLQ